MNALTWPVRWGLARPGAMVLRAEVVGVGQRIEQVVGRDVDLLADDLLHGPEQSDLDLVDWLLRQRGVVGQLVLAEALELARRPPVVAAEGHEAVALVHGPRVGCAVAGLGLGGGPVGLVGEEHHCARDDEQSADDGQGRAVAHDVSPCRLT